MEARRETVVQFYEDEDDPALDEEERRIEKRLRIDNNDKYDVDRYLNETVGNQDIFENWTMLKSKNGFQKPMRMLHMPLKIF